MAPAFIVGQPVAFTPEGIARFRQFVPGLPDPLPPAHISGIDDKGSPTIYYITFAGYRDPLTGRRRWGFLARDLVPVSAGDQSEP